MSIINDDILTTDEACSYLKISKSHLYKLTSQKAIRYFKPNNKTIYFLKNDLIRYILSGEINSNTEIKKEALKYINNK